jgi:hypothetical protein
MDSESQLITECWTLQPSLSKPRTCGSLSCAHADQLTTIPMKNTVIRFISAAKLQKILHICKFFRTFAPDFNLDEYA